MADDLKDEVLSSLTELDRLGYVGGPDEWTRRINCACPDLRVTVKRTPKGWVMKLEEAQPVALGPEGGDYEYAWFSRETNYYRTFAGVVAKARNYTGLIVTSCL